MRGTREIPVAGYRLQGFRLTSSRVRSCKEQIVHRKEAKARRCAKKFDYSTCLWLCGPLRLRVSAVNTHKLPDARSNLSHCFPNPEYGTCDRGAANEGSFQNCHNPDFHCFIRSHTFLLRVSAHRMTVGQKSDNS